MAVGSPEKFRPERRIDLYRRLRSDRRSRWRSGSEFSGENEARRFFSRRDLRAAGVSARSAVECGAAAPLSWEASQSGKFARLCLKPVRRAKAVPQHRTPERFAPGQCLGNDRPHVTALERSAPQPNRSSKQMSATFQNGPDTGNRCMAEEWRSNECALAVRHATAGHSAILKSAFANKRKSKSKRKSENRNIEDPISIAVGRPSPPSDHSTAGRAKRRSSDHGRPKSKPPRLEKENTESSRPAGPNTQPESE